jgi:copper transport protein
MVGLVVLAVTAVLVAEPPGRAAVAAAAARPKSSTINLGNAQTATLSVRPGKHGPVTVSLALSAGARPTTVTLTAALPAKRLGPITIPVSAGSGQNYTADNLLLPAAGKWTFQLTVRTSQFDAVTAATSIHLS